MSGLRVDVRIDPESARRVSAALAELAVEARHGVLRGALNRTASRVKTRAGRQIAAELKAKVRETGDRLKVYPAHKGQPEPVAKVWMGVKQLLPKANQVPLPHEPFQVPGREGKYVRVPPGYARTSGRPHTSPPNLPITSVGRWGHVAGRLVARRVLEAVSLEQMQSFFPGEVRRLVDAIAARLARRARR